MSYLISNNLVFSFTFSLILVLKLHIVYSQSTFSYGDRPLLVTPTTPEHTDAYTKDYPTGLEKPSNYTYYRALYPLNCGVAAPTTHTDCTSKSRIDNSCCFFREGPHMFCFWYGSISRNFGGKNSQINCSGNNLSINIIRRINFLFIIFFIILIII